MWASIERFLGRKVEIWSMIGYLTYLLIFLLLWFTSFFISIFCEYNGLFTCISADDSPMRTYYAMKSLGWIHLIFSLFILFSYRHYLYGSIIALAAIGCHMITSAIDATFILKDVSEWVGLVLALFAHLSLTIYSKAISHAIDSYFYFEQGEWKVYIPLMVIMALFDSGWIFSDYRRISPQYLDTYLYTILFSLIHVGISVLAGKAIKCVGLEWRHNENISKHLQNLPNPDGSFYDSRLKTFYAKINGYPVVEREKKTTKDDSHA